ncbi:separin-like [Sinocyclocheilus grahami]|uniref:separin-like n=1 Tax=Sinocyclocheilus grahami TaxID=75366 RepID=UPI0007AC69D7|nr:PREDICTED: separin-like [Sinocyclocheilus grahami]
MKCLRTEEYVQQLSCVKDTVVLHDELKTDDFHVLTDDFHVLVRNCFAVLWNSFQSNRASGSTLLPQDRLHCQLQALTFKLLEQGSSLASFPSKVPLFVEEAVVEYERSCGGFTHDDVSFLSSELRELFFSPLINLQDSALTCLSLAVQCEVVFKVCKLLCKSLFSAEAVGLLSGALEGVDRHVGLRLALSLADHAVQLQSALSLGGECSKAFTESARSLRGLSRSMSAAESHALLEACQLVVWAMEAGQCKGMDVTTLLACLSFLEEYQELLLTQQKDSFSQQVQYSLCFSFYQGFIITYDSLHVSQVSAGDALDRVLLFCQTTAGRMLAELRTLNNDNFLLKAVCAVNNVVYELFNRKLYEGAFGLAVIVCQELCKDCPPSLPVDRVNRCFMLTVQCSRRGGQLERALDWIVRWIQVLGTQILDHLAEPVSLWVKTKCDAARAGEDDTRLRTLRDGLGEAIADEEVMMCLSEEELRLYKEQTGDTTQERYNTLCDLLDICHEETPHTLRRATYLSEMAQVVCYQDFSQQTDCSAVDFTHEALWLLDSEPETAENADRLMDEKAHASLWLYICTLETNLQEAVDTEKRLRAVQEENKMEMNMDPVPTNDLEYEDKQKSQESQLVYDGLCFNLLAQSKLSEPLDRCLSLWRSLLKGSVPAVRDPKLTASSMTLMAALYTLMGKHLQALEGYQLAAALFRSLGDAQNSANAFCQSARILLYLGSPQLAQVELKKAEQSLTSVPSSEGTSVISMLAMLQKAQIHYALGQMERGVCCLMEVIKESAQHHSKSWYLLRARTLQTASEYLSLDTETLDSQLRQSITQHGLKTPDTAQYEGLKLLCSLVMMLLGNGFYGAPGPNTDTHFVDQGDSVVFKWLLLSEVLVSSERMVTVRSSSGAVHEAKAQCLEALKLATKLQTLSHCAELLVLKAELELKKGANEASSLDLDQVRNLLDLCTDFGQGRQQKSEVKIKPRKGRPAAPSSSGHTPEEDDDLSGILSSRALLKEPVETMSRLGSQGASPPLKPKRQHVLSCLTHTDSSDLSVEAVQSYLRSSWLLLHHFPPPSLFPHICSLLAQSLGQTDPTTTAMLHAQSLGVSTRHHMTRHVVSQFRKLKKSCNDVAEGLGALSLEETSGATQSQKLSALEQIFSFTSSHPTQFPQTHCQQFTQQLKDLPAGITVCMLSLTGVYPDEIGSTILLTRLERGSTPITVRIPTADRKRSVAVLLEEMDRVLKGQKEVSTVAEKSQWWEGRQALDARVEKMLEEMEEALRVWRTLLLPLSSDPELEVQVKCFQKALKGTKITQDILKVVLSASPLLSLPDLQCLVEGMGQQDKDFPRLLQGGVTELRGREEPKGHTVLILDKFLQRLPWENIACLKSCSVTRMPSLHAVLGHGHLKESGSSLLQHLAQSRNATHLKHIIGAAPIAYGLPVYIH